MRHIKHVRLVGVLLASAIPQTAIAGTATADLDILATVDPACTAVTTPVDFGTIDPTRNTSFLATGSVSVTCTPGTSWEASSNDGRDPQKNGFAGGALQIIRSMERQAGTPTYMKYVLYSDAARANEWRASGAVQQNFTGIGTGYAQMNIVYGEIPAGQTQLPPGHYEDLVEVTVEY